MRHREERKKIIFFLICSSISKVSHWNQEGAHSLEKLGDQKRIEEEIFGCENQVT